MLCSALVWKPGQVLLRKNTFVYFVILPFSDDKQFQGFPGGSDGEELAGNAGDLGLIPGLGRSSGEGKG